MRGDSITIAIDTKKAIEGLKKKQEAGKKVVARTVSDMKSRAPGAVASAVTDVFRIKKSEVTPVSKSAKGPQKKAVSVKVTGETIENLALVYQGRRLTPIHFGMTPKAPTPGQKYKIQFEVRKGQKKTLQGKPNLAQPAFLAPNGAGQYIPFQRRADGSRGLAYSVRTTSVPQMIQEEKDVEPDIQKRLNELLSKRLEYHMSKAK